MRRFKFPKLRHPWAKSAAGFTLVELIVVIAILGVLAGVGTVGYSGYVKSAEKKADQALIANIVRAIEIGNSSYAHELQEVLQPGEEGIQIPIGFIVVSKDGITGVEGAYTQVFESATRRETVTTTLCQKSEDKLQLYKYGDSHEETITQSACGQTTTDTQLVYEYEPDGEPVFYCTTHTKLGYDKRKTGVNDGKTEFVSQRLPTREKSTFFEATGEHAPGSNIEGFEEQIYAPGQFDAAESGILHNALVDAFGTNYIQELKLQSDKWNEPTLPTFYSTALDMWGDVADLAEDLFGFSRGDASDKLGTTEHGSAAELVFDFANEVAGNSDSGVEMTEKKFMDFWANVGTRNDAVPYAATYGGYGFGFNLREDYSAARKAYNASFASYVKVTAASVPHANHSDNTASTHAAAINDYGKALVDYDIGDVNLGDVGVVPTFPQLICQDAFDNDSNLKVKDCPACQELYKKYISTGADMENGKAFYDTMITVANTDERIVAGLFDKDGEEVSFFDYYNRYLNEFNGMYESVYDEIQDGSCIAICVYLEDDVLSYVVSPDDAYQVPQN